MFRKNCLICLILTLTIFSSPVFAKNSKIIKVGYYENEVFQEGAKPGKIREGYAYEYYRKISEYTGWSYKYEFGNFVDLYKKLEDGEIDLLAGLAWTKERADKIFYESQPMGNSRYFLVKKFSNYGLSPDVETLNGKKIGVFNSLMVSLLNNWLKENNVSASVVIYDDYEKLFSDFNSGIIDTMISEDSGTYGNKDIVPFIYVGKNDYYLCVSKKRPDLLAELNTAHNELLTDNPNFFSSLYAKYFSKSISSRILSETEWNYVENNNFLTIGYLNNYLPYCDTDSDGKVTGLLKDIIPSLFERLGLKGDFRITYKAYDSYNQIISAINRNEIDIAFPVGGGLYFSEENGLNQSEPVVSASVGLVFDGYYIKDHNPVFAVCRKNNMQYYYTKTNFPSCEIKFYDTIQDCLDAILKEDADFTTINGLRLDKLLKNSKYKKMNYHLLPQVDDRCFGVKIGNEILLRILNRGINSLGEQFILNQAYPYTDKLFKYSFADYLKMIFTVLLPVLLIAGALIIIFKSRTQKKLMDLNLKLDAALKNKEKYIADMIRYSSSESDANNILTQLVEYIGKNTNSDRVYVFEENKNHNVDNTYEWCKAGITAEKENLQNVPYDVIQIWIDEFSKRGTVMIKDVEAYKNVSQEIYNILKPQNISSLAAIPLQMQGKIIGFIGVDNPPAERIEETAEILQVIEFFFVMMIRVRNGVLSLEEIALHDQLTGLYNRYAYEAAIKNYRENGWTQDWTCISVDVNGLKLSNDTIGHEAGDELIAGAAACLSKCLGHYGNVYRIGGDEFIGLINVKEEQLEKIKEEISAFCSGWEGRLAKKLSLSCGFVSARENPDLNLHEMTVLADKKMYEAKSLYYRTSGIDRRRRS